MEYSILLALSIAYRIPVSVAQAEIAVTQTSTVRSRRSRRIVFLLANSLADCDTSFRTNDEERNFAQTLSQQACTSSALIQAPKVCAPPVRLSSDFIARLIRLIFRAKHKAERQLQVFRLCFRSSISG